MFITKCALVLTFLLEFMLQVQCQEHSSLRPRTFHSSASDSNLTKEYLESHEVHFTSEWVVRLRAPREIVDQIAFENGYEVKKQLSPLFPNTFVFVKINHPKRTKRESVELTKMLASDTRVDWAEQQVVVSRVKRGRVQSPSASQTSISRLYFPDPHARGYRPSINSNHLPVVNDELWAYQWYLRNAQNHLTFPAIGLNIEAVWAMGYTGKNIRVIVLDDGMEHNHTDLQPNYDPEISYDTNDDDDNPFPRYDPHNSNSHGTKCAGEIAMVANNRKCGVGVAPDVKIGAVRCLDGQVVDQTEAASLGYRMDLVDIYSASWGPPDDGAVVDGPKRLTREVMEKGIMMGRKGKGVIFVWASGNGGSNGDNCNCDGYASSIFTVSIGSADQHGQWPWYGERCSSTIAVAYSSGTYSDSKIATTDLFNRCTVDHTGTSAAAPLATGIIALLLEANNNLTWRDVQHLIVYTSYFYPLKQNTGWYRNGAGFMYNSKFGFGLLDAKELVQKSLTWKLVPEKSICSQRTSSQLPVIVRSGPVGEMMEFNADACAGTANEVNSLEHVQILMSMSYTVRGLLDMYIKSPSGTVSMILTRRKNDKSRKGFNNWFWTSLHFWGERPRGKWTFMIRDRYGRDQSGLLSSIYLIFHGTKQIPEHLKQMKAYPHEAKIKDIIDPMKEYELTNDMYDQNSEPNNLGQLVNLAHTLNWNDYGHALTVVHRELMDSDLKDVRPTERVTWPDEQEKNKQERN